MGMRPGIVLVAGGLLLTGCGAEVATDRTATSELLMTPGTVTVLDDGGGAELCLGGVAESLPPQCGGPAIPNWEWADHQGEFEEVRGVRWGDFHVVGTYDGERFTTTDAVAAADFQAPPPEPEEPGWTMPCDDMAVVDPSRLGHEDFEAATAAAGRLDTVAWVRVDSSADERSPEEIDQALVEGEDEVPLWAIDVRVTDDLAGAEATVREHWGGRLCVTQAERTEAELRRIQRAVSDLPDHLSSGTGLDHVELHVVHDAGGALQQEMDATYGEGVVRVSSALVPANPEK